MRNLPLVRNVLDNPILTRELRRRMRGKALVFSIIGYILVMTAASVLILLMGVDPFSMSTAQETQRLLQNMTETGQRLFRAVTLIQVVLVLLIAPTITAGMTTNEKERKTFDFLRVTTISPWMYITGCFLSTVFYVTLALVCALPLLSLAFLYGGIGKHDVLVALARLLSVSMALSAFGLYVSSIRDRTRTAQGIVVFVIFSLCFGGLLVANKLAVWLGGTTAAVTIANFTLPGWAVQVAALLGVTVIFLLMAARKLFEPEETRAFSHWQFGLVFISAGIVLVAGAAGSIVTDLTLLVAMSVGPALLATAVVCFAVGRMEVGDEVWQLKRLVPVLRPIDQTAPFLVLVGLGWLLVVHAIVKSASGFQSIEPAAVYTAAIVTVLGYGMFCAFGRLATALSVGRRGAGRAATALMASCWLLIPLFASIFRSFDSVPAGSALERVAVEVGSLSPFFVLAEGIDQSARYQGWEGTFSTLPVLPALVLYGGAGLALLAWGEYKRWKRWGRFDYHYDMPAA